MDIENFLVDGQFALFQRCNSQIYLLNDTARFIWERTARGFSDVEIARDLIKNFSIAEPRALADVRTSLADWRQRGLLETQTSNTQSNHPHTPPTTKPLFPLRTHWHNVWKLEIADTQLELAFGSAKLESLLFPILGHLMIEQILDAKHRIHVWEEDNGVFVSGKARHFGTTPDQMVEFLIHEVIECSCRERNFRAVLHAGAVLNNDSSILLAGAGGSGKSTLVSALQCCGYPYLSDDISPLEKETGRLVPFPMCQSLKKGSWAPLQTLFPFLHQTTNYQRFGKQVRYLAPQHYKATSWRKHWPVAALIFPRFDSRSRPGFEQLSTLQALQSLISSQSLFDQPVQDLVAWLEMLPCYTMQYRDLNEGTGVFKEIMSTLAH